MTQRIRVDDLPEFDAAPYLNSEEAIAAYLTDILEANDTGLLTAALSEIARARGVAEVAKQASNELGFDSVNRACAALGIRLVAQPAHPRNPSYSGG